MNQGVATAGSSSSNSGCPPHQNNTIKEKKKKLNVGIYIFHNVEVLDYAGPFEVFSITTTTTATATATATATEQEDNHEEEVEGQACFNVKLIADDGCDVITTIGGMQVLPHTTLSQVVQKGEDALDILIIPGGDGTKQEREKPHLIHFIQQQASSANQNNLQVLASVCTGARLLGQAGLLNGKRATSHWSYLETMAKEYPLIAKVEHNQRWVYNAPALATATTTTTDKDNPKHAGHANLHLYTSAGISAGIDMSLKIVQQLVGKDTALRTAKYMEYPFPIDLE